MTYINGSGAAASFPLPLRADVAGRPRAAARGRRGGRGRRASSRASCSRRARTRPSRRRSAGSTPQAADRPRRAARRTSAAVRAAFAQPAEGGRAARSSRSRSAHPKDPVVQFNYGDRALLRRLPRRGRRRRSARRRRRAATPTTRCAPTRSCTRSSSSRRRALPALPAARHRPAARRRACCCSAQGHQHSAERLYARAARLHPDDDEAQVAAAVGRFDEDDLSASFSRLGPLVEAVSAAARPCATTSACCSRGPGQRDQAIDRVPAGTRARRRRRGSASRRDAFLAAARDRWD